MSDEHDFDSLFKDLEDDQQQSLEPDQFFLFIGNESSFTALKKSSSPSYQPSFMYSPNIENAVPMLLANLFAIVFIEYDDQKFDVVTSSRVVRVNHPLARIVLVSKHVKATTLADIINKGSIDGYYNLPIPSEMLSLVISEHLAKHEINRTIVQYISNPPKMSKASYLLLDPTLTFSDGLPVKFVGIMITHTSVPRVSKFFEQLLAKDEILFSGYLSGISILGEELFKNNEPLKEIHFGGISVIFRFHEELSFAVFVRNLSPVNVERTEDIISKIVSSLIDNHEHDLAKHVISKDAVRGIHSILSNFEEANEEFELDSQVSSTKTKPRLLIYGLDKKDTDHIKNYLTRKAELNINSTTNYDEAVEAISHDNYGVIILDSILDKNIDSVDFARFAKEVKPHIQIIYRFRDRRAKNELIKSLNSQTYDYLIAHTSRYKSILSWVNKALEKAMKLEAQSLGSKLDSKLDQATIARRLIKENFGAFSAETIPEMQSIFITKGIENVAGKFAEDVDKEQYDQDILAGIVASLDTIGTEIFKGEELLGKMEMGGAQILVEHYEDFNFGFMIKNLNKNTEIMITKELKKFASGLMDIILEYDNYQDPELKMKLEDEIIVLCNRFRSMF